MARAALSGLPVATIRITATNKENRFRDIQAKPRKSGIQPGGDTVAEDEHVSYNAGYTNVLTIPWRTLSGRLAQLYQDHQWMRDFGENLLVYRPPIDTRSVKAVMGRKSNAGNPEGAQLPDAAPEMGYPLDLQR